jgi:hypothetical protein
MLALFLYSLILFSSSSLVSAYAGEIANDDRFEVGDLLFVFNQPQYAPGDTAYFTGYLLQKNQPRGGKVIVSIKLLGPAKEILHHGRVLFQEGIGISQIIIPNTIQPGSYQFVSYVETNSTKENPVFNFSYLVISSKDLRLEDDLGINFPEADSSKFRIETDRDTYGRRSKVRVSIAPVDIDKSSQTSLSISVYSEKLFKDADQTVSSSVKVARRVPTIDGVGKLPKSLDFPNYFKGNAFIKSSNVAVPDSTKITFYLNENDFAYVVYTTAEGNFNFPLFKNFGNEEVFYRITYKGNLLKDCKIVLHDPSMDAEPIRSKTSDTINAYGFYARQRQFINNSYNYFVTKDAKIQPRRGYESDLEPDNEYLLEKYESFTSMAEIFSNIITSVRYRKEGGNEKIRIFLKETAKYGVNDPLYIVNGFMTDDTRYVLKLDPKIVRKVGVLRSNKTLTRFGDLGLDGIIEIETNGKSFGENIRNSENSFYVIGIDKAIEYKKLDYGQNQTSVRIPDVRSSLYWNSKLDVNRIKEFEFYTSDDSGSYIIQLAGLVDGTPFVSRRRFTVTQEVKK